jgi:hypothetical protein
MSWMRKRFGLAIETGEDIDGGLTQGDNKSKD